MILLRVSTRSNTSWGCTTVPSLWQWRAQWHWCWELQSGPSSPGPFRCTYSVGSNQTIIWHSSQDSMASHFSGSLLTNWMPRPLRTSSSFRITLQSIALTVFLVKMCPLVLPASRLPQTANRYTSALSPWHVSTWEWGIPFHLFLPVGVPFYPYVWRVVFLQINWHPGPDWCLCIKLGSNYDTLKASKAWSGTTRPDSSFKTTTPHLLPYREVLHPMHPILLGNVGYSASRITTRRLGPRLHAAVC